MPASFLMKLLPVGGKTYHPDRKISGNYYLRGSPAYCLPSYTKDIA